VGGRVIAAAYPKPASSFILRFQDGKWTLKDMNSALLKNGMVSGALWTDLNADGYPELVLACEWGPLKIFANDHGKLRDATQEYGMDKKIGWWNGIAAGDFDGDGRMDLIASNWGLNSKYKVSEDRGPRLYHGAWGVAGEVEPLEAYYDRALGKWVPERDLHSVARAIPIMQEKFASHRAFAEASIEQVLGVLKIEPEVLEVNWLETTIFLNRGQRFELGTLPASAQFSPAFGINVADFDGDGHEDIFLGQNFFAVQPQTSRNDAGRGLLLKGKGNGAFKEMDGSESGIKVYGEQRGSAAADFDHDGRVDLAVTQNAAATTLWRNVRSKAGLRVRLQGPPGNPSGIGAKIRLAFKNGWGPAREIHAGSGYWSQNSPTQVLATPDQPERIQVFWPGGKTTTTAISPGSREISIAQDGVTEQK
jgi:hypothetical protein